MSSFTPRMNINHMYQHDEEEESLPTSLFSQVKMAMDPEEFSYHTNPPSDAELDGYEGDGPGMQTPASAPEMASPPSDSDYRLSMEPEMVREDLRELLRDREVKRKSLQEKFSDENLAMNRGNL